MRIVLLSMLALVAAPLQSQSLEDWRIDLAFLGTELPARHRNAFARMTAAQWDSALVALDARLPSLGRHERIVEFMRIVALVRDGHTAFPPIDPRLGFHRLPIRLYDFKDGLHIVATDSANAGLAGAKVLLIGRSSAEAAVHAAGRLVSHESPNWARARAADLLGVPEVLAALGLSSDTLSAEFTIEQEGRRRTVRVAAAGMLADAVRGPPLPVDAARRSAGETPLYLQQPDDVFWYRVLPDSTLYISYRAVQFFASGMLNEQFFRRAFAAGDTARVVRVVLDIRNNGGGNNFLNRHVVREVIRRPALDNASGCLVIIGRGTFSAAQNLVNELDYMTNCAFVGEPTGNAPNQYGDARPLELPRTKFVVRVSSLLWQSHAAADERAWFQPDVYVEADAADYASNRDVVLAAALTRSKEPTLAARLEALAAADTARVRSIINGYRYDDENRYANVEGDINAAGYVLLRGGKTGNAVLVFKRNTELYPRSGNAFDSLGEALERAERKDDAIAAYKKALELDPRLVRSRDALARLGANP